MFLMSMFLCSVAVPFSHNEVSRVKNEAGLEVFFFSYFSFFSLVWLGFKEEFDLQFQFV